VHRHLISLQVYGTALSSTLIPGQALSGSLGLAFAGISGLVQSSTRLFWQEALAGGSTDMSLYLARVLGTSNTQEKEPGGMFTFGGIDTSLYSGNIEFLQLTGKSEAYWSLNVVSITVNGVTISAQASTRVAAFDMSSSILPGPPGDVARIWAAVPNSSPIQNQDGFYSFRKYLPNTIVLAEYFPSTACDSPPSISFSFGTKARSWPINLIDMGINPLNATHCVGAIFALFTQEGDSYFSNATTGSDRPSWTFGGTFLKNVYSVFRQDPPSIGFAELSTLAGGTGAPNSTVSPITTTAPYSGPSESSTSSIPGLTAAASIQKKKNNVGAIAGGVVGGLLALGIVIACATFLVRRNKRRGLLREKVDLDGDGSSPWVASASAQEFNPSTSDSSQLARGSNSQAAARKGARAGAPPPVGSAVVSPLNPAGQATSVGGPQGQDPAIVNELRMLREEVRQLTLAPPVYVD
ncbi:aspartic peptidase domain-containing protein, partial [Mycena amicta]